MEQRDHSPRRSLNLDDLDWSLEEEKKSLVSERQARRFGVNVTLLAAQTQPNNNNAPPQARSAVSESQHQMVATYRSKEGKKFGLLSKAKVWKDSKFDKVKYKAEKWEIRGKETANETFSASANKKLGHSGTDSGIGKQRIKKGDQRTASIDNLHLASDNYYLADETLNGGVLLEDPRMLARQVASWRLARSLNIRVLSQEKYVLHEGELVAISAKVSGRSLQDVADEQYQALQNDPATVAEKEDYLGATIFSGKIQKELSDLQLMDALTGQTDRHSGNIFIDVEGQTVRGIDNDQSFGYENSQLNAHNALASFALPARDSKEPLRYRQTQIDFHTAEKVLAMTPDDLVRVLVDKAGYQYGEYLNDTEIDAARERLIAIQTQIKSLRKEGKLVKEWNANTYRAALDEELKAIDFAASQNPGTKSHKYGNYLARMVHKIVERRDAFGQLPKNT